jgi:hypothetical protein
MTVTGVIRINANEPPPPGQARQMTDHGATLVTDDGAEYHLPLMRWMRAGQRVRLTSDAGLLYAFVEPID